MRNDFYNAYDQAYLDGTGPEVKPDHRHPFAVDRDRLVFSFAFRRLQSKTQVFLSGVYDYSRTRLTHSLEVARIGRSICDWLRHVEGTPLREDFHIDADLVEAICLAHDVGHPSYGHTGERKLNELMADHGGFEGNAQTVRVLTDLIYENGRSGMRPTRAFLDGVMKYKALHGECQRALPDGDFPLNHFLYDSQASLRAFVSDGATSALPGPEGWNASRSIECQIMDWADDSAYSLHDILDGARTGYITETGLRDWGEQQDDLKPEQREELEDLRAAFAENRLERKLSRRVGDFIQATRLITQEHPLASLTQRYAWTLAIDPTAQRNCHLYKRIANDLIFNSVRIQQNEYKGGMILERLFDALMEHYVKDIPHPLVLLPKEAHDIVNSSGDLLNKSRLICDFLASLTDLAAPRLYKQLFDPDHSSIA